MATKVLYAVPVAHEAACRRSSACAPRAASSTFNRTGRTLPEVEPIALLPGVFATIAGGEP